MNLSAPYAGLLPRTEGQVLLALARTSKPLSGREVARLAGTSPNGAWTTLRRLVDHGLVTQQEAGRRTLLYTLNRDHLAAEAVLALVNLRSRLADRLRALIDAWTITPLHASVFGSAARGDGDTASDVDLFLVRPSGVDEDDKQWRAQMNELAEAVLRWTGNHAGISDISGEDVERLGTERPPIVSDLERDAIVLCGPPPNSLFGGQRE